MPIKDKEKNREYQRKWAAKKAASRTEEAYKAFRRRRNAWRRSEKARAYERAYQARPENKRKKSIWSLKREYGEYYEAYVCWKKLQKLIWNDPRFEAIDWVRYEKERTDRRRSKGSIVGDHSGGEEQ